MAFRGGERAYDALDDRVLDGPVIALWQETSGGGREIAEKGLIEILTDTMRPFVSEEPGELQESMRRERRWHYPLEALARVHRQWDRSSGLGHVTKSWKWFAMRTDSKSQAPGRCRTP